MMTNNKFIITAHDELSKDFKLTYKGRPCNTITRLEIDFIDMLVK